MGYVGVTQIEYYGDLPNYTGFNREVLRFFETLSHDIIKTTEAREPHTNEDIEFGHFLNAFVVCSYPVGSSVFSIT